MEQNTTNKPLRRVGTLTLGVCLIAAGTLFLLARFLPGLPWLVIWQVLPAAGLILLGCEVLYYSARRMPVRLRLGGALPADDGWVLRRLDPYAAGPDAGPRLHHPPVNTRKPVQSPGPGASAQAFSFEERGLLYAG